MLVTFSTDNYANIMMFGDVAQQFLTMMGHSGSIPGAIIADDVPIALEKLKRALSQAVGGDVNPVSQNHKIASDDDSPSEQVSLKNRALPLLELLEAAAKNKHDVMWK